MVTQISDRLAPLPLPDLSGRRVVITGSSAGIGLATATALAATGAELVLAVRNTTKGERAVASIRQHVPDVSATVQALELGSLASIDAFAERLAGQPVDLLINNAGLSSSDPQAVTSDGFDLQVGVNFLGAYALTSALWSSLTTARGRVVMLGSMMATRGTITAALGRPTGSTVRSYSDSKLATVVFAQELRRRGQNAGSPVSAVAAHPGWCQTAIFTTNGPPGFVTVIGKLTGAIQSPADGAQPVLLASIATDPAPYYGPTKRAGAAGPAAPVPLPAPATAADAGELLWQAAERLTGHTINF